MRVAMIMSNYPELSEKFLINQVEGLVAAGVEVDVYASHRFTPQGGAAATLTPAPYVRYVGIPRSPLARLALYPKEAFLSLVSRPKAFLKSLDSRVYGTAAKNLKLLPFARFLSDHHYDAVHCHFGWNGLVGAFLKDVGVTDKLVVSFHGSDINSYPSRYGERVYAGMYQRADVVTSNTNFTNDKVVANGCPREKTAIIPECLPTAEYPMVDSSLRDACTLLTVGRLVEKKGHRYTLEAVAKLVPRFPELRYLVAGDGPLRQSLEAQAEELGISDRVSFLGACDYATVRELYAKATVFALPSVTAADGDREGQGLVLQEAQARGLPVVSTWHNGIPDGVLDGETGYLVSEKDTEALADRLGALLSDSGLRSRMGRAGRVFVEKRYDSGSIAASLMELYRHA